MSEKTETFTIDENGEETISQAGGEELRNSSIIPHLMVLCMFLQASHG